MNRIWINLVVVGVIIVAAIVAWDVFLTVTGNKSEFQYTLTPIENRLFGKVEAFFREDPDFTEFQNKVENEDY